MKDTSEDKIDYDKLFIKKVLKSSLFTVVITIITTHALSLVLDSMFQAGDLSLIVSFLISIIFTIFYCTLTIIDEIQNMRLISREGTKSK